jgi:hypothetical protein
VEFEHARSTGLEGIGYLNLLSLVRLVLISRVSTSNFWQNLHYSCLDFMFIFHLVEMVEVVEVLCI